MWSESIDSACKTSINSNLNSWCDQERHQKDYEVIKKSLKKLSQFERFAAKWFFENLSLGAVGQFEWKEHETGAHMGAKVEVVIIRDKHNYNSDNGQQVGNIYEKMTAKVPKDKMHLWILMCALLTSMQKYMDSTAISFLLPQIMLR